MLVSLNEVLKEGKVRNIAVGAFNTPCLEAIWAVIDAAEELNVPVILSHAQIHESIAPLDKIAIAMVEYAKAAKVKVCVHLDHGEDVDYIKRAISKGFTSVMIDASTKPYAENIKITREVTDHAHKMGVSVEGELGRLASREDGSGTQDGGEYTDPNLTLDFIAKTNVDALAIAFGTAHGIYKTKPVLNIDIVKEIRAKTLVPLVMHGGSGVSDEEYVKVIGAGISKINYYTYMAHAGYKAAKEKTDTTPEDYFHQLSHIAYEEMRKNVTKTLKVFSKQI